MNPITHFEGRAFGYGGGVRLLWMNPDFPTLHHVKIVRKTTNLFEGPTDPSATVVYAGGRGILTRPYQTVFRPSPLQHEERHRSTLDTKAVQWATTYYYAAYAMNQDETDVSSPALLTVRTPDVSLLEEVDVIGLLMDYVRAYFKRQIVAHQFDLPAGITEVQVLDSPPLIDSVTFPCISLHLDSDAPDAYLIGDDTNQLNTEGDTAVHRRGYLASFNLAITGWTENPEIRRHLYRHLKGCLFSARQLLEQSGVMNTTLTGRYGEDFESYNLPMFSAAFNLKGDLQASVRVIPVEGTIAAITVADPTLLPITVTAQEG